MGRMELDCAAPKFERKAALKNCVERLKEVRDLGLETSSIRARWISAAT